jgi:type IV secretion system protein VirB10
MFGQKKNEIIDGEIKPNIEGERGGSQLGSQRKRLPAGARNFLIAILVCAGAVGAMFTYKAMQVRKSIITEPVQETSPVQNNLPALKQAPPETPQVTHVPTETTISSESEDDTQEMSEKAESLESITLLRLRRLSAPLVEENQNQINRNAPQSSSTQENTNNGNTGANSELQNKLTPLKLNASQAGLVGDRDMLLTQGSMIDCQLETSIVTSQPGMTSCHVTRDIYSTSGRVVLIDRGSKIVGNYQSGLQQGQTRIFVLWSRIETPAGVIINLDSPGTGSLGEAGVGGTIDNHFWERFGNAILFSFIGDFGDWASNQGGGDRNSIQFYNTSQGAQQSVTEILKYSMTISPTLYKNQGDRVSIFVARDLYFGGVYALKPN